MFGLGKFFAKRESFSGNADEGIISNIPVPPLVSEETLNGIAQGNITQPASMLAKDYTVSCWNGNLIDGVSASRVLTLFLAQNFLISQRGLTSPLIVAINLYIKSINKFPQKNDVLDRSLSRSISPSVVDAYWKESFSGLPDYEVAVTESLFGNSHFLRDFDITDGDKQAFEKHTENARIQPEDLVTMLTRGATDQSRCYFETNDALEAMVYQMGFQESDIFIPTSIIGMEKLARDLGQARWADGLQKSYATSMSTMCRRCLAGI